MKNFEKYEKEILDLIEKRKDIGLNDGMPVDCDAITCPDCGLDGERPCRLELIKWFYSEYKERPKLTRKEHMLCEILETGWIARDSYNAIWVYKEKPKKGKFDWYGSETDPFTYCECLNTPFDFIQWFDEEPWSVEDLLKLDVEG